MTDTVDPLLLSLLVAATAAQRERAADLLQAEGAVAFLRAQIETRYGLGPADVVEMETGAIVRAPAPEHA